MFYYIKVGFKGVKIILACFRDGQIHTVKINSFTDCERSIGYCIVLNFEPSGKKFKTCNNQFVVITL